MCRLLGIAALQPVDLSFSMADAPRQFSALKQNNPDGWGLGYFSNAQPEVRKHELPVKGEPAAGEAEAEARADLFLAHVRRSSRMPRALRNTHPFAQNGWLFAHTGALYPLLEVNVRRMAGRAIPYEGQTDSEALFHLLLANLQQKTDPIEAIRASVSPIIQDGQLSGLNFLLARAGTLYAFRYAARSASYYALWWRKREAGKPLDASSRDNYARVRSTGLASTESIVVCSEQLEPDGAWRPMEMGELLVIRSGPELGVETVRLLSGV